MQTWITRHTLHTMHSNQMGQKDFNSASQIMGADFFLKLHQNEKEKHKRTQSCLLRLFSDNDVGFGSEQPLNIGGENEMREKRNVSSFEENVTHGLTKVSFKLTKSAKIGDLNYEGNLSY